jgi:hypothetical protein
MQTTTETAQQIDPELLFTDVLHRAEALILTINEGLARLRNTNFRVPGETDDHLQYRKDHNKDGPLSVLGAQVMLDLLKLGLTDEQVAARMTVTANSVGVRRRKWGRKFGQKG